LQALVLFGTSIAKGLTEAFIPLFFTFLSYNNRAQSPDRYQLFWQMCIDWPDFGVKIRGWKWNLPIGVYGL